MTTPASPATNAAAHWAVRIVMLLALAIVLCPLAACGGGGDDEPIKPTPVVDCKTLPELCK